MFTKIHIKNSLHFGAKISRINMAALGETASRHELFINCELSLSCYVLYAFVQTFSVIYGMIKLASLKVCPYIHTYACILIKTEFLCCVACKCTRTNHTNSYNI